MDVESLNLVCLWTTRPGKSVRCSLDPETSCLNVPKFCPYILNNTLHIMSINVFKRVNKEQLRIICILKYNLSALTSKHAGDCSKWS